MELDELAAALAGRLVEKHAHVSVIGYDGRPAPLLLNVHVVHDALYEVLTDLGLAVYQRPEGGRRDGTQG